MDWPTLATVVVPVVSVVSTAAVAIWTKHIDAATKREDRQHDRALNYEERVWQAKSDVLRRLISACRRVKERVQVAKQPGGVEEDYHGWRSRVVQELADFKSQLGNEDGVSDIVAYAAEPVRDAVDEMLGQITELVLPNRLVLLNMRRTLADLERLDNPGEYNLMSQQARREKRSALNARLAACWAELGTATAGMDLDAWTRRCDHIIDVARRDLQGRG